MCLVDQSCNLRIEASPRNATVACCVADTITDAFQLVVWHLMNEFTLETDLCFECMNHCKENGLCANGEPEPRFMAGKESDLPAGMKEIKKKPGAN